MTDEALASIGAIAVTAPEVATIALAVRLGAEYMKGVTGHSIYDLVQEARELSIWNALNDSDRSDDLYEINTRIQASTKV